MKTKQCGHHVVVIEFCKFYTEQLPQTHRKGFMTKDGAPFMLLRFGSIHIRTDRKVNAKANPQLTQTHTRRHYTTTV